MTMTIDLGHALAVLNRLAAVNLSPWMEMVGRQAQESIQHRIRESKLDPENAPWSPWMPSTEMHRRHKGNAGQGLLWDQGTLLNSIRFEHSGDSVAIGTDVDYAKYLQDGTGNMAARPFVGWSDGQIAELEFSAVRFLEGLIL
jgi:phage gpG-like protein